MTIGGTTLGLSLKIGHELQLLFEMDIITLDWNQCNVCQSDIENCKFHKAVRVGNIA